MKSIVSFTKPSLSQHDRNHLLRTTAFIALSWMAVAGVGNGAELHGTRAEMPRVGLSWIAEGVELDEPAGDPYRVVVVAEDITGYFQRLDVLKNENGQPKYTRATAAKMITSCWELLRDEDTTVSVVNEQKAFAEKDDEELVVDRFSVKVTRSDRTIQGIAYVTVRGEALIAGMFVTENRATALDNMMKTVEQAPLEESDRDRKTGSAHQ